MEVKSSLRVYTDTMAKITHNAIIADIRGKRGDKVYTIYRGSHITRTYNPNPTDHKTPRQLQIRSLMGNLMTCYWNLPVEYQELWEKYGQRKYDTRIGRGAFIQANIRLLSANHPELTQINHPPPTPSTPPSIAGFNWFFPDRTTARISWTAPLVSTHFIQVTHRLNWNYSTTYNLYWAQVKTLRSDCGQYDWAHPYPPDTEIHIKLRVIDTWGKTSPFTHTIKEIVPMAELDEHTITVAHGTTEQTITIISPVSEQQFCVYFDVQSLIDALEGEMVVFRLKFKIDNINFREIDISSFLISTDTIHPSVSGWSEAGTDTMSLTVQCSSAVTANRTIYYKILGGI